MNLKRFDVALFSWPGLILVHVLAGVIGLALAMWLIRTQRGEGPRREWEFAKVYCSYTGHAAAAWMTMDRASVYFYASGEREGHRLPSPHLIGIGRFIEEANELPDWVCRPEIPDRMSLSWRSK